MPLDILLADPTDPRGASALRELLQVLGHQVAIAESLAEADRRLKSSSYDVAIVEIATTTNGGDGTLEHLFEGHSTQLVALSALARERDRRLAQNSGFREYLVKPIDIPRLLRVLNDLTDGNGTTS